MNKFLTICLLAIITYVTSYGFHSNEDSSNKIIVNYLNNTKEESKIVYRYIKSSYLESFLISENEKERTYKKLNKHLSLEQFDSLIALSKIQSKNQKINHIEISNLKVVNDSEALIITQSQSLIVKKIETKVHRHCKKKKITIIHNPYDSSILFSFSIPVIFNNYYCIVRVDKIRGLNEGSSCTYLLRKNVDDDLWNIEEVLACQYM